jgi:hypothetical protein
MNGMMEVNQCATSTRGDDTSTISYEEDGDGDGGDEEDGYEEAGDGDGGDEEDGHEEASDEHNEAVEQEITYVGVLRHLTSFGG